MHLKKIPLITVAKLLSTHTLNLIFPSFFNLSQKILILWATFWDYNVQLIFYKLESNMYN